MDLKELDFLVPYTPVYSRIEKDANNIYYFKRLKEIYETKIEDFISVADVGKGLDKLEYDPNINYEFVKILFMEEYTSEKGKNWISLCNIIKRGGKWTLLKNFLLEIKTNGYVTNILSGMEFPRNFRYERKCHLSDLSYIPLKIINYNFQEPILVNNTIYIYRRHYNDYDWTDELVESIPLQDNLYFDGGLRDIVPFLQPRLNEYFDGLVYLNIDYGLPTYKSDRVDKSVTVEIINNNLQINLVLFHPLRVFIR